MSVCIKGLKLQSNYFHFVVLLFITFLDINVFFSRAGKFVFMFIITFNLVLNIEEITL